MKLKNILFVAGIALVLVGIVLTIASLNSSYTLSIAMEGVTSGDIATQSGFIVQALEKITSFAKYLSCGVFCEILGVLFVIAGRDSRKL